jgi:hypothetical protein
VLSRIHGCPIGGFHSGDLSMLHLAYLLCLCLCHLLSGDYVSAADSNGLLDLGVLVVLQVLHHHACL